MRIFAATIVCISLFFISCQKEADYANGNNGSNGRVGSSSTLLVKTVKKSGSDSFVTTYGYNANKKLIIVKELGPDGQGNFINAEYHYHRNASGIVTDYSIIDADLVANGIDSIVTIVHYSSSRYTSYVLSINVSGFVLLDSSVFVYDASGKIVGENLYESPSGAGNDYYLSGKIVYTYSSGNISRLDIHDLDASGAETFTASTFNINYDAKVNPIILGNEGFALGHPEWACQNNIISEQLSDSNGPADDQTVTSVYTYNSENKPGTNTTTVVPDNTVTNVTYYYQ